MTRDPFGNSSHLTLTLKCAPWKDQTFYEATIFPEFEAQCSTGENLPRTHSFSSFEIMCHQIPLQEDISKFNQLRDYFSYLVWTLWKIKKKTEWNFCLQVEEGARTIFSVIIFWITLCTALSQGCASDSTPTHIHKKERKKERNKERKKYIYI